MQAILHAIRFGPLVVLLSFLAGCGGGGGSSFGFDQIYIPIFVDSEDKVDEPTVASEVSTKASEEQPATVTIYGSGLALLNSSPHLKITGGEDLVLGIASLSATDTSFAAQLTLRSDLAPGRHQRKLTMELCSDSTCTKSLHGPWDTAVILDVESIIKLDATLSVSRPADAAEATFRFPISVPSDSIGPVTITMENTTPGYSSSPHDPKPVDVRIESQELVVVAKEAPEGGYTIRLTVASDNRTKTSTINYQVSDAANGHRPLRVMTTLEQPGRYFEGDTLRQVYKITPPSWTRSPITYALRERGCEGVRVNQLDDITFEASQVATRDVRCEIDFYPATKPFQYPIATSDLSALVASPITSLNTEYIRLDRNSGLADLQRSVPVTLYDGSRIRWTASTTGSTLRLTKNQGYTGEDPLTFAIDMDAYDRNRSSNYGVTQTITLSLDRPNTQPLNFDVNVTTNIPTITQVSTKSLPSQGGRLILAGENIEALLATPSNYLTITGATVTASRSYTYQETGEIILANVTAGSPIQLRVNHPLRQQTFTIQVQDGPQNYVSGTSLAAGSYRPAVYSPTHESWYFASAGKVWRYAVSAVGAGTLSSQSISGLLDVDIDHHAGQLVGVTENQILLIDPISLGVIREIDITTVGQSSPWRFSSAMSPQHKTIIVQANGNWYGSMIRNDASAISMLRFPGIYPDFMPVDSSQLGFTYDGPIGLTLSAGRLTALGSDLKGGNANPAALYFQNPLESGLSDGFYRNTGNSSLLRQGPLLAVSNEGDKELTMDGRVGHFRSSTVQLALTDLFAVDRHFGGATLTGDGQWAWVYTYRIASVNGQTQADSPTLSLINLSRALTAPLTIEQTINLPIPIGCAPTRPSSEPCSHQASVNLDATGRHLAVLGPNGLVVMGTPPQTGIAPAQMAAKTIKPFAAKGSGVMTVKATGQRVVKPKRVSGVQAQPIIW